MFSFKSFNFFRLKKEEEKNLLDSTEDSLNEVHIDSDEESLPPIIVKNINAQTKKKNLATHPTLPRLSIYKEIPVAIKLLKNSKKNLASYRKIEKTRRNCVGVLNILCLLTMPSLSFTLMFKIHQHLAAIVLRRINAILPSKQQAEDEYYTYMDWYDKELAPLNHEINQHIDPVGSKFGYYYQPCFKQTEQIFPKMYDYMDKFRYGTCWEERKILIRTPHFSYRIIDYCALNQTQFSNPECNHLTDYLCDAVSELLNCMDEYVSHLPEYVAKKVEFVSDHEDQIDELGNKLGRFTGELYDLHHQSTWNPFSQVFFGVSIALCSGLAYYLYQSWQNAKKEYENDIEGLCSLEDCLDQFIDNEHDRNYIINLASELKISLKNISLLELINKFKVAKHSALYQDSSITFFMIANRYQLSADIAGRILKEAELPVLRRR